MRDLAKLRKLAIAAKWIIVPKRDHEQWRSPDGATMVHVPKSSGRQVREGRRTGRQRDNLLAALRRGGLEV
jgi:hypothetical protein